MGGLRIVFRGGSVQIDPAIPEQDPVACIRHIENMQKIGLVVALDSHWLSDRPFCMSCNGKFGVTNRKHTCRVCGRILCGQCLKCAMEIPVFRAKEAIKVCDRCYQALYAAKVAQLAEARPRKAS